MPTTSRPHPSPSPSGTSEDSESTVKVTTQRANPQCTHVIMDRVRGDYLCDNCHQPSSQKWLYICTQDIDLQLHDAMLASERAARAIVSDNKVEVEMLLLNMSTSIISQWRKGTYSPEQIEILKEQKRHVAQAIDTTNIVRCAPNYSSYIAARKLIPSYATPDSTNSYRCGEFTIMPATTPTPTAVSLCHYKCCHRCRPYFRERLPTSIESVLQDEHGRVCAGEAVYLPMINSDLVRTIGQHESGTGQIEGHLDASQCKESTVSRDRAFRYSPVVTTATSTPSSFDSSTIGENEEDLDDRLRRLVTGSEPILHSRSGLNYYEPRRPSTVTGEIAHSESDSTSSECGSACLSPLSTGDMSFSTFLSANTDNTPASSPGKCFGLSFAPAHSPQSPNDIRAKPVYAARDNASMESLGLDDDMVLVAV